MLAKKALYSLRNTCWLDTRHELETFRSCFTIHTKQISICKRESDHLIKAHNFSMVFTKKVHAYYDVETSELHRNEIDWEDVIVELESTITENRVNGDSSSSSDFDFE
ncbi:hypothetical protein HanRHA438_Chr14g0631271 [Helianthus annuus]|nr:hypothetical protein HanRHA438_Chr14g0631271 [Helianthus annuus]